MLLVDKLQCYLGVNAAVHGKTWQKLTSALAY